MRHSLGTPICRLALLVSELPLTEVIRGRMLSLRQTPIRRLALPGGVYDRVRRQADKDSNDKKPSAEVQQVLAQLEALGDEKVLARN